MLTIAETATFRQTALAIWSQEELDSLIETLANAPDAGDLIPGSGGLRKVRWSVSGRGKRGGARVIYTTIAADGVVWLLIAYTKAKFDNLPMAILRKLKNEIQSG